MGPRPRQLLPSGFFSLDFFFWGIGPCGPVPPAPLERNSILPLVTAAVLITPKGAEPPDSRRIGVIGVSVLILPSETVLDKLSSP